MRNFKELIKRSNSVSSLKDIGFLGFGNSRTDKNSRRTPHYEQEKAYEAIESIGFLQSNVNRMVLFIMPKFPKFESKHKKSETFLNKWLNSRKDIFSQMRLSAYQSVSGGNVYIEPLKNPINIESGIKVNTLDSVNVFPNPVVIYLAADQKSWILQVPTSATTEINYRGKTLRPRLHEVYYQVGTYYPYQRIWGIPLPADTFIHLKFGYSRTGIYGKGFFTTIIDSANVHNVIKSNWDTISKTRALNQKIVQFGDANSGVELSTEEMAKLESKLTDSKDSYLGFTIPVEVKSMDIAHVGNYDKMDKEIDFLRRDMNNLPAFLSSWGDASTSMGSSQAREGIRLEIESYRNELEKKWADIILGGLRDAYPWLDSEAVLSFGTTNFAPEEEVFYLIQRMYESGLLDDDGARHKMIESGLINEQDLSRINSKIEELKKAKMMSILAGTDPGTPIDSEGYNDGKEEIKPSIASKKSLKNKDLKRAKELSKGYRSEIDNLYE